MFLFSITSRLFDQQTIISPEMYHVAATLITEYLIVFIDDKAGWFWKTFLLEYYLIKYTSLTILCFFFSIANQLFDQKTIVKIF